MRLGLEEINLSLDRCLEAATDPSLWAGIMEGLVHATGSFGANIIPASAVITPDLIMSTDSMKAPLADYFSDGWHMKDWRFRGVPLMKTRGTARDQEYTSEEEFKKLAFYRLHAKYGIGKSCIIAFSSGPELLAMTLHRTLDADFYSDEEAVMFRKIGDRLTTSAMMARAFSASKVSGMMEAFTRTGVAAIFFDRFCRVTELTPAAHSLFGDVIDVKDGVLRSRASEVTTAIQKRMRAVISERWLHPHESSGPILIPQESAKPLALHIQRLGGNLPDFFAHSVGVCLIDGTQPQRDPAASNLRRLFGLTAAECEISLLLLEGKSLRDIAKNKQISYETVRTHVRSVLGKTDTKRQTELIAFLSRLIVT